MFWIGAGRNFEPDVLAEPQTDGIGNDDRLSLARTTAATECFFLDTVDPTVRRWRRR